MQIAGLDPVVLTILITIAGVGLNNTLGWLKSKDPVKPRQVAASGIIGFFTGYFVVAPLIEAVPADATGVVAGTVIITALAAVAGIDQYVKSTGGAIKQKLK